jgi:hypothetical protein
LTVAQRSRFRAKVTKALRSPTEVPAWDARRPTKRRAPTPRRPPSSLTRAKKDKPWLGRGHPLEVLGSRADGGSVAWCGGGSRAFSIVGGNGGANIGHGGEETKLFVER